MLHESGGPATTARVAFPRSNCQFTSLERGNAGNGALCRRLGERSRCAAGCSVYLQPKGTAAESVASSLQTYFWRGGIRAVGAGPSVHWMYRVRSEFAARCDVSGAGVGKKGTPRHGQGTAISWPGRGVGGGGAVPAGLQAEGRCPWPCPAVRHRHCPGRVDPCKILRQDAFGVGLGWVNKAAGSAARRGQRGPTSQQ